MRLYGLRRLHAKLAITDTGLIVGSTNWTNASLRNVERGVLLRLSEAAHAAEVANFDAIWDASREYDGKSDNDVTPGPPRRASTR